MKHHDDPSHLSEEDNSHPTLNSKTPPVSKGEVEQVGETTPMTEKAPIWPTNWEKK